MKSFLRLFKNTLIVAYEAGGAQILSCLVTQSDVKKKFLFCVEGPAIEIFKSKIGIFKNVSLDTIRSLNPETDLILTGTSFIPDLERNAIQTAKAYGLPCATFLDHWANYVLRFVPISLHSSELSQAELVKYLPDYIIVSDRYQYRLAIQSGIFEDRLLMKENPYLANIKQLYNERAGRNPLQMTNGKKCLLYFSEPVFDDVEKSFGNGMAWGYSEWDIVESLIRFLEKSRDRLSSIIFRLHPNEDVDKYDHLLDRYKGEAPILKSKTTDILDDIVKSDLVVGSKGMGLVIALICGKLVFSYLPVSAKRKSCLPHKGIKHISNLDQIW